MLLYRSDMQGGGGGGSCERAAGAHRQESTTTILIGFTKRVSGAMFRALKYHVKVDCDSETRGLLSSLRSEAGFDMEGRPSSRGKVRQEGSSVL